MSDLSGLTSALADLKTEVDEVATRMDTNFQLLLDAQKGGDQPAIDAAAADVRADIDALKAVVTRDTPAATP